ncbi:hypothetical protein FSP39_014936, partial [Pinctada imbricata]
GKEWPSKFSGLEIFKEIHYDSSLDSIYALQYSFDSEVLAVGFASGAIHLYNSRTGEMVSELRKPRYGGMQIMCLRFHPKEHHILLATTSDGKILACNTKDGTVNEVASEKGNEINCLDFSCEGFEFATGGKDLAVRIYNAKTYQLLHTFEGYSKKSVSSDDREHCPVSQRIWCLKFHPDNPDIFMTGGWDNQIKIWDIRSEADPVRRSISGPHICGDAIDVQWSEKKGYVEILTGSWCAKDGLQIWKYSEPEKGAKSVPFQSSKGAYLYTAKFCDNDVVMAGGSGTNSVEAINSETGELIGEVKMQKPIQALDTCRGGRLFAVGGGEFNLILGGLIS